MCAVLKVQPSMAQWLSWLERRPVTAEVVSSSLIWVVTSFDVMMYNLIIWGLSSAGRASALQAEGHRFEPYRPHRFGWIPEWPKGADCKSVGTAFEGSNPSPSTEEQKREPKYLWSKTKTVRILLHPPAAVAELADAQDLKSCEG